MKFNICDGWVPFSLAWEERGAVVGLALLGKQQLRWPFLPESLPAHLPKTVVPLDQIDVGEEADPRNWPTGFIFHMGRCGSTLVTRMLASVEGQFALNEPDGLNEILHCPAGITRRAQIRALRRLVATFARALRRGNQPLVIKWTSWAVLHLPLIDQAFPGTPCAFLHRDPVEVLVSLLARRPGWKRSAVPSQPNTSSPPEQELQSDAEFFACCLSRFCESAAGRPRGILAVSYNELPQAVWTKLAPFFGIPLTDEAIARMRLAADFYSKDPQASRHWAPDAPRKQAAATPQIRAAAERLVLPAILTLRAAGTPVNGPALGWPQRIRSSVQEIRGLSRHGQYFAALSLARSCYANAQANLPEKSPDTLDALTELAGVYRKLCQYKAALEHYLRLLAVDSQSSPAQVCKLLGAVGLTQQGLGTFDEAERTFKKVLQIRLATVGPEDTAFGIALNALATLEHKRGNHEFAEKLYRQVCRIQAAALGDNDPHHATSLNNLATFLLECGRWQESLALYERVVAIRGLALGESDPVFASGLNNLAEAHRLRGELERAEQLHWQALRVRLHSLSVDHPHVARSLLNLASLLKSTGRYQHSCLLLREALDLLFVSLGEEHPLTRKAQALMANTAAWGSQ